jgi:hypothetical protein
MCQLGFHDNIAGFCASSWQGLAGAAVWGNQACHFGKKRHLETAF